MSTDWGGIDQTGNGSAMQKDDTTQLVALVDVPAALGLLSRLPVPIHMAKATARGARAAWAYPIAGLILALVAGAVAHIALAIGLPSALAAGLTLATLVISTGAMHEDGLADAADGLWGGWDRDRRLDIMKDSRIGVYGVVALIIGLGLRWQALTLLFEHGALWAPLLATALLSRAAMVPLMALMPHARDTGLSHSVGRPQRRTAGIACALAAGMALLLFQGPTLILIIVSALSTLACAGIARAKIGGQTGDILGATQQICEIALLLTLAALAS